jgi:ketosteroid isomerase-like protein
MTQRISAFRRAAVLAGAVLALAAPAAAQTRSAADSTSAHAAATRFLAAFDSLQWEPFTAQMADNVTMFFPFPDTPSRADGKAAVMARFKPFFDAGRPRLEQSGRRSMGISPRDLRVQMAGDAAIVSFHLGAGNPARRSLVFQRQGADWKLVHWHASPAPAAAAPQQ